MRTVVLVLLAACTTEAPLAPDASSERVGALAAPVWMAGGFQQADDDRALVHLPDGPRMFFRDTYDPAVVHLLRWSDGPVSDQQLPAHPSRITAVGDLDGDGLSDAVWLGPDGVIQTLPSSTGQLESVGDPRGIVSSLAVADLDGDGLTDVVATIRVTANRYRIEAWREGTLRASPGELPAAPTHVGSLDSDPVAELIVEDGGRLWIYDGSGAPRRRLTPPANKPSLYAVLDIDSDGVEELFWEDPATFWPLPAAAHHPDGSLAWTIGEPCEAPSLADADLDGDVDLICSELDLSTSVGTLRTSAWDVYSHNRVLDASCVSDWCDSGNVQETLVADFDGDGATEAWFRHDQLADWGGVSDRPTLLARSTPQFDVPPGVWDIDGDGADDILWLRSDEGEMRSHHLAVTRLADGRELASSPPLGEVRVAHIDAATQSAFVCAEEPGGLTCGRWTPSVSGPWTHATTTQIPIEWARDVHLVQDAAGTAILLTARYARQLAMARFDEHGVRVWQTPSEATTLETVADIDGDGTLEILGLTNLGALRVLDFATGALEASYPETLRRLAVADSSPPWIVAQKGEDITRLQWTTNGWLEAPLGLATTIDTRSIQPIGQDVVISLYSTAYGTPQTNQLVRFNPVSGQLTWRAEPGPLWLGAATEAPGGQLIHSTAAGLAVYEP